MLRGIFLFLFITSLLNLQGQPIATIEVSLSRATNGVEVPVSVDLDNITFTKDSALTLVELQGNKEVPVPFQVFQQDHRYLYWLVNPGKEGSQKRVYRLVKGTAHDFGQITATESAGALTIHDGNENLLRYNYETVYPP